MKEIQRIGGDDGIVVPRKICLSLRFTLSIFFFFLNVKLLSAHHLSRALSRFNLLCFARRRLRFCKR